MIRTCDPESTFIFINSQLALFSVDNSASFAVLAAGLAQALGTAGGIIQAIALVAVFGGIIGAMVSALSEKHLAGVKTSLVIAAIGGSAWLIATAFFAADWIADGDANNLVGGRLFVGLHPLHMLVIAETGGGKSVIVQTIALQSAIALKFLVVIDDGLS
jgi:hypothetical protein